MCYRLWFGWDRCGWNSKSLYYSEPESITFLNKKLDWHQASKDPDSNSFSPDSFTGRSKCLEFQTSDEVVDYLISLDFIKAFQKVTKRSRPNVSLSQLFVVRVKREEVYREDPATEFLLFFAGQEVLDLVELQLV